MIRIMQKAVPDDRLAVIKHDLEYALREKIQSKGTV